MEHRLKQQITKLVQFLSGDYDSAIGGNAAGGGGAAVARLRGLLPVVREYRPQLSLFGRQLVARLTEKSLQRSLNWASDRLSQPRSSSGRRGVFQPPGAALAEAFISSAMPGILPKRKQ